MEFLSSMGIFLWFSETFFHRLIYGIILVVIFALSTIINEKRPDMEDVTNVTVGFIAAYLVTLFLKQNISYWILIFYAVMAIVYALFRKFAPVSMKRVRKKIKKHIIDGNYRALVDTTKLHNDEANRIILDNISGLKGGKTIEILKGIGIETKVSAIEAAVARNDNDAIKSLLKIAKDKTVGEKAKAAILNLINTSSVQELSVLINDNNEFVCNSAVKSLLERDESRAGEIVVKLSSKDQLPAYKIAESVLLKSSNEKSIETLIEAVGRDDILSDKANKIFDLLARMDEEKVSKSIAKHLDNTLKNKKLSIIRFIDHHYNKIHAELIISLLNDDWEVVKEETIDLLKKKSYEEHKNVLIVEALLNLLKEGSNSIKLKIVELLKIKPYEEQYGELVVDAILQLLKDKSNEEQNGELLVGGLLQLLKDNSQRVRLATIELIKIKSYEEEKSGQLAEAVLELLNDNSKDIELKTIELLETKSKIRRMILSLELGNILGKEERELLLVMDGLFEKDTSRQTLEQAIDCKYPYVRLRAVEAIGKNITSFAPDILDKVLKDEDQEVRQIAVRNIAESEGEEGIDILKQIIKGDYESDIAAIAIEKLSKQNIVEMIPFYIDRLNSVSGSAAEKALANFDDERITQPISSYFVQALKHLDLRFDTLKHTRMEYYTKGDDIWETGAYNGIGRPKGYIKERIQKHKGVDMTDILCSAFSELTKERPDVREYSLDPSFKISDEDNLRLQHWSEQRVLLMRYLADRFQILYKNGSALSASELEEKEKIYSFCENYLYDPSSEINVMVDSVINRDRFLKKQKEHLEEWLDAQRK